MSNFRAPGCVDREPPEIKKIKQIKGTRRIKSGKDFWIRKAVRPEVRLQKIKNK